MFWRRTMSSEPSDPLGESDTSALPLQNEQETGRARKSLIYELFVLGELMDGPHHGYQLREILSNLFGPFRQISWGVLYPLIRQLELEGLIASEAQTSAEDSETRASSSRQRKQYLLTESGRKRFYALILERGDYSADYRELFMVKLNNFDHLSCQQQLTVLWHYRGYLQVEDFYLLGGQQHVSTDSGIPENQRAHILRIISFRRSSIQGEIQWIEQQIKDLEEQSEETR
jgi:DNA-binding PadR family transcriptional regulator